LAAETDFSPLHGKAQCALRSVVGRLNAFMEDEGKEMIPVLECPVGAGGDSSVAAGLIVSAQSFHAASDKGATLPELFTGKRFVEEGIPTGEEFFYFV
jgi:hypothetical protein